MRLPFLCRYINKPEKYLRAPSLPEMPAPNRLNIAHKAPLFPARSPCEPTPPSDIPGCLSNDPVHTKPAPSRHSRTCLLPEPPFCAMRRYKEYHLSHIPYIHDPSPMDFRHRTRKAPWYAGAQSTLLPPSPWQIQAPLFFSASKYTHCPPLSENHPPPLPVYRLPLLPSRPDKMSFCSLPLLFQSIFSPFSQFSPPAPLIWLRYS